MLKKWEVKLNYFKSTGKFYSCGSYKSNYELLYQIWDEVESMKRQGVLPGLHPGHHHMIISIDVPEHPHNHPHLIL